jgi:hypothetical protein
MIAADVKSAICKTMQQSIRHRLLEKAVRYAFVVAKLARVLGSLAARGTSE